jgi:hypothetical protein
MIRPRLTPIKAGADFAGHARPHSCGLSQGSGGEALLLLGRDWSRDIDRVAGPNRKRSIRTPCRRRRLAKRSECPWHQLINVEEGAGQTRKYVQCNPGYSIRVG